MKKKLRDQCIDYDGDNYLSFVAISKYTVISQSF